MNTVVEVGAYEGKETERFLADADASVYSFEPHGECFKKLQNRSALHPRWTVLPFAVDIGDNQESLFMYEGGESTLHPPYFTGKNPPLSFKMVWTMRLDTFMDLYSISVIDYLRIDAPYREEMVLESLGAYAHLVERGRIRIYDPSDSGVPTWLYSHGFSMQQDTVSDRILQPDIQFWR